MEIKPLIESLLFVADEPVATERLAAAIGAQREAVEEALQVLGEECEQRGLRLQRKGGRVQMVTAPEAAPHIERFLDLEPTSRLSAPALETLAIVAYRQPIGRIEVEYIRGVGAAGVIRTLQDRDLVGVVGRGEGLGRPLLYGTTQRFLEHFGFASLDELPRPEELPVVLSERTPLDDLLAREAETAEGGAERDSEADAEGGPDPEEESSAEEDSDA